MLTPLFRAPATTAGDDLMAGLLWSMLEVTTAFVIACVPATRLFLKHYVPNVKKRVSKVVSTVTSTTLNNNNNNNNNTTSKTTGDGTKSWRGLSSAAAGPGGTVVSGVGRESTTRVSGGGGNPDDDDGREGEGYEVSTMSPGYSAKTATTPKYVV